MRSFVITLVLATLFSGIVTSSSRAQQLPTEQLPTERIRTIARNAIADLPGLAVAIGRPEQGIWTDGFGLAALDPETPVTADTRFRVYSVSKPWTAAAGLRLVVAGRLDPEAPIQVPGFPDKDVPITAFQLATHASGIRHYREGEADTNRGCETVAEAVELFADDPLLFPPGTDTSYSTWGYVLLGAVLEQATGQPFDSILQMEVLGPTGMIGTIHVNATTYAGAATPVAHAYERSSTGYRDVGESTNPSCKWGGGGYLSTAADLARFPLAALSGRILPESAVGLLFDREDGAVERTGGSGPGGTAYVRTDLESGLVVALATNVGGELDTMRDIADRIAVVIESSPAR